MSGFDEEPEGDPHGECVNEIRSQAARIKELEAERDALQVENEKIKVQREEAWQAFTRLRKAYSMVRYPTLAEELRLLYDTADAVAAGKTKEG